MKVLKLLKTTHQEKQQKIVVEMKKKDPSKKKEDRNLKDNEVLLFCSSKRWKNTWKEW